MGWKEAYIHVLSFFNYRAPGKYHAVGMKNLPLTKDLFPLLLETELRPCGPDCLCCLLQGRVRKC